MTRDEEPPKRASFAAIAPFYNEEDFLGRTLESLADQRLPPALIVLVDNASTDGSRAVAEAFAAREDTPPTEILDEATPGKINALARASAFLADAPGLDYLAFCDADTFYPRHYFSRARDLFEEGGPGVAAAMAIGVHGDADAPDAKAYRRKTAFVGGLLAKQCHTGGYGQIFRRDAFVRAGGFSPDHWPYVLLDHEVMQRVLKQGDSVYHADFWCQPSDRRSDRTGVRWTLLERILYHLTPFAMKDWFFYRFLGPRFAARGLFNTRLREQTWRDDA